MTAYLDDLHIRLLSLPSSRPFYFCLLPSVPSPPSVSVSFFFSTTISLRSSPSFRPSVSHSFSTSTSLRLPLLHLSLLPSFPSVILSFPLPLFLHLYLPPFLPFLPSFRLPLLTSLSPIPYSLPPSTYLPSLPPFLPCSRQCCIRPLAWGRLPLCFSLLILLPRGASSCLTWVVCLGRRLCFFGFGSGQLSCSRPVCVISIAFFIEEYITTLTCVAGFIRSLRALSI